MLSLVHMSPPVEMVVHMRQNASSGSILQTSSSTRLIRLRSA